jgi:tripeptide aminopeptidase
MPVLPRISAFSRVTALAAQRPVHAAFAWMHGNPKTIMDWQASMVAIPAPPFGEEARAEWLSAHFAEAGLSQVHTDEVGNVFGVLPAAKLPPESTGPLVVLSAHLDTVFPADTPLNPVVERRPPGGSQAPAITAQGLPECWPSPMRWSQARAELRAPLILLGNVGEEGEGNLRGVRHFYDQGALAGRIMAHIVLDGAGADSAVTQALGSRRFQVTIAGPGGHSFTDAGTPNPIAALASALAILAQTPLPAEPRTTLNLGTVHGGTSVNSIPEAPPPPSISAPPALSSSLRLEVALHRAVEDSVQRTNASAVKAETAQEAGDRCPSPSPRSATAPPRNCLSDSPLLGGTARRGPASWPAHRSSARIDRRQYSALAGRAGSCRWALEETAAGRIHRLNGIPPRNREVGLKRVLLLTLGYDASGLRSNRRFLIASVVAEADPMRAVASSG